MRTATEEALLLTADQVEIEASAAAANPCVQFVTDTGGLMTVTGWGPVAIELTGIDASADQVGILGADPKTSVAITARRTKRREKPGHWQASGARRSRPRRAPPFVHFGTPEERHMDGAAQRIGQFEFTVATCEPSPEARERWANRVDTLTRWLLAQWDREQAERGEDEHQPPEPSLN